MSRKQFLCSFSWVLFALCMGSADAWADIFVFTDDGGTPHFSDAPTDSRYWLFMREEQPAARVDAPYGASSLDDGNRRTFVLEVRRAASSYQLDEALLHAVIAAESGYNSQVVSRKGAMGLMQLMPETARRYKVKNSFDPAQNIDAGARYLSSLMAQFGNNTQLALAAYNAGENNVRKYGGRIPPFPETMAYVPKVMDLYRKFRQELR